MNTTVLLADDHAIISDGLRVILDSQVDMKVVGVAANGNQAVAQVQRLHPDVVVMDISMPVLNGIDAARQITDQSPDTRIIILSVHASSEHVFHALQAGARGYVLKESAATEVVTAVREVRAGRRFLSQKITDLLADDYVRSRESGEARSPLARLSNREREILQLVVEGRSSAEIAKALFLSPKTVDTYRSRLMSKLGIGDLPTLVKFAIQHGLTSLE
ncbi:MAG: response regulator [Anaerolineae bacterium]